MLNIKQEDRLLSMDPVISHQLVLLIQDNIEDNKQLAISLINKILFIDNKKFKGQFIIKNIQTHMQLGPKLLITPIMKELMQGIIEVKGLMMTIE